MTELLRKILGRLPIGYLQLTHNKSRFFVAMAGIAFANLLVFMQLGFLDGLEKTIIVPYKLFNTDILISASDANTFTGGSNVARQRQYQALSTKGVKSAASLYIAKVEWTIDENNETVSLMAYGYNPNNKDFLNQSFFKELDSINIIDNVIIDRKLRNLPKNYFDEISLDKPRKIEINNRKVSVIDTFILGGGFLSDGHILVSDETFMQISNHGSFSAPKHILIKIDESYNIQQVINNLQKQINSDSVIINSFEHFMEEDRKYQTTKRPIGIIFGFGAFVGVLVGVVIVYQILSNDVADHLKEYATFRAIGYKMAFFKGIVIEEAVMLAILGFIPGSIISCFFYMFLVKMTGLPISMTLSRLSFVLIGTIVMCSISGMLATRKLQKLDPAELF